MGAYAAHSSASISRTIRAAVGSTESAPLSSSNTPIVALTIDSPRAARVLASWFSAKIGSSPGRSPLTRNESMALAIPCIPTAERGKLLGIWLPTIRRLVTLRSKGRSGASQMTSRVQCSSQRYGVPTPASTNR